MALPLSGSLKCAVCTGEEFKVSQLSVLNGLEFLLAHCTNCTATVFFQNQGNDAVVLTDIGMPSGPVKWFHRGAPDVPDQVKRALGW